MANSAVLRVSMLILIILSANMINLEAVTYRGVDTLLQKLGYDMPKRNVTDAAPSKVTPSGPDPVHHP
ncbi:hypothetical protein NC653_027380 [Populus alba x Populus x berolinensis]|uniref:CLAVATA3/ESR (CLE)-related protein n=1 Tax=Populus alba x Populus x berolinensis TaxID=444605 RepID=A0AAD6M5E6_9ROSI|nr:hypothetical protein NC653_027380 [Populus alba x Populus x berolinensis]